MNSFSLSNLALPIIGTDVPTEYVVPGVQGLCAPLAIQLIELGLITDDDFRLPAQSTLGTVFAGHGEKRLVEQALTKWWTFHTEPLRLFNLTMHIQAIDPAYSDGASNTPWICLTQQRQLPQYLLERGIGAMENELAGFGQTVMAVLDEVFSYLPWTLTPSDVYGLAQNYYWQGETSCEKFIEWQTGPYGEFETREAMIQETGEPFTDEDFFAGIPSWLACPKRIHSRAKIVRSVKSGFAKEVIAACDAIHRYVTSPSFRLEKFGFSPGSMQMESVGACALLRWNYGDALGRVVDDSFNLAYECGEYNEFASARQIPESYQMTPHMQQLEQMCELAALAESLLNLVGEIEE